MKTLPISSLLAFPTMLRLVLADPGHLLNSSIPCPVWRVWSLDEKHKLPTGMTESSCLLAKSMEFQRGFTHVTLYQTEETWQQDPRRDQVISGVAEAIQASLDLFGKHAGSPSNPFTVIATLSQGYDWVVDKARDKVQIDKYAAFNWNTPVTEPHPPCHILIHFPFSPPSTAYPVTGLQKEVVRRMYQCVIKYHHPTQGLEDYSTPWWSPGIARFFDGLAWPTTPEILWHNDAEAWGLPTDLGFRDYPEEYRPSARIYQTLASSALFWHSVHNTGWSPERVTEWMKRHPDGYDWHQETEYLARDPDMGPLFHDFGRRLVDGQIRYPGGEGINVTTQLRANELGGRITEVRWERSDSPLSLVGVPGVVQKWWVTGSVGISGWELQRINATFVGGQRVNVSVSHAKALHYDDRLRWSVKLAGEDSGWETGMGGEWKELVVLGGNGTTRVYDFVVTSTATTHDYEFEGLAVGVLGL